MNLDWKGIVATVAPALATMLGGPLAGTVVGELSQTLLGKPNGTQEEVAAAIGTSPSPDTLLKIKQLETDLKSKFIDAGIEWAKLVGEDTQNARQMQSTTRSRMPAFLTIITIVSLLISVGTLCYMGSLPKDPGLNAVVLMVITLFITEYKASFSFWLGTTASSADKNDLLSKALDR